MASRRSIRLGRACKRIGHTTSHGICPRCLAWLRRGRVLMPAMPQKTHRSTIEAINYLRLEKRLNGTLMTKEPIFTELDRTGPPFPDYIAALP